RCLLATRERTLPSVAPAVGREKKTALYDPTETWYRRAWYKKYKNKIKRDIGGLLVAPLQLHSGDPFTRGRTPWHRYTPFGISPQCVRAHVRPARVTHSARSLFR